MLNARAPAPAIGDDSAARAAGFAAFALLANQVAGKSIRDALFLTNFDVAALPRMFAASAFVALAAVLLAARPVARLGPHRILPGTLAACAVLQVAIWLLASVAPGAAAIALYLLLALTGSAVLSWFWGMLTDRFDPRAAKARIASIAASGTLGGLAGGALVALAASRVALPALLPALALLSAAAAWFTSRIGGEASGSGGREASDPPWGAAREALRSPVVRGLALLAAFVAMGAIVVDFVFKARARAAFPDGAELLRFFASFYAGISLVTFLIQALLARRLLQRAGLAPTVAALPAATVLLGIGALVVPGLAAATALRGAEGALRASLFRSGYELFFTPMARRLRRAVKSLVDVGADRLGEGAGAFAVQLVLAIGIAAPERILLVLLVAGALVCLALAPWLHRGYVAALEERLLDPADALDPATIEDHTTRTTFTRTLRGLSTGVLVPRGSSAPPAPAAALDPLVAKLATLRSGDVPRVRELLASAEPLETELVPQVIRLLAWDAVAGEAGRALARGASRWTGQLADALLDPDEVFAVRRRIPRLLAVSDRERAVAALVAGLGDARFEVRYRCAQALGRQAERRGGLVTIEAAALLAIVERETRDDRLARSPDALIDADDADTASARARGPAVVLRYVGRLLALAYPGAEVEAAFLCLERGDARRRGTALEYLETLLPGGVREPVTRFVERWLDQASPAVAAVPAAADPGEPELERSHATLRTSLEEIRRASRPSPGA